MIYSLTGSQQCPVAESIVATTTILRLQLRDDNLVIVMREGVFFVLVILLLNFSCGYGEEFLFSNYVMNPQTGESVPIQLKVNLSITSTAEVIEYMYNYVTQNLNGTISMPSLYSLYEGWEQQRIDAMQGREKTCLYTQQKGGNNIPELLVEEFGYRRVFSYSLRGIDFVWVMWPWQFSWDNFVEGSHIVNYISGIEILDRKDLLLMNLKDYLENRCEVDCMPIFEIFPPTYDIASTNGCASWLAFLEATGRSTWLYKQPATFGADGLIFFQKKDYDVKYSCDDKALCEALAEYYEHWHNLDHKCKNILSNPYVNSSKANFSDIVYGNMPEAPKEAWVQQFVYPCATMEKRKFTMRAFMLILSVSPSFVLFHDGQIYRAVDTQYVADWELSSGPIYHANGSIFNDDRYSAITNGVYFKHPLFNKTFYFDDLQFTWQQLQHKLDDLPVTFKDIKQQIKRIMLLSYKSAKLKLKHRIGTFQLLAADFAVDATGKVWLHEFNVSPGFKPGPDTYTSPLAQRLKKMSNDAVRLSIGAQRRQIDGKNLYDSSWMNECTNNTEWEELFIERA